MIEQQWYDVGRIVHLAGGIRAINNPGPDVVIPLGSEASRPTFSIDQYHHLPWVLQSLGFDVIGTEYYETSEQVKGYYPSAWYPFGANKKNVNASSEAEKIWSQLAHSAFQQGNMELMDLCSRISFEAKACNQRLRQLSDAYNAELWSLCEQHKFSPGRVETLNSFSIYLETHDLLRELCTLRDYLSEFVANFILADSLNSEVRIRLMSKLRKQIRKMGITDSSVASEICTITDEKEDGWLARLSAYRDLVVHYVPIGQAVTRAFVVQRFLPKSTIGQIPSIYFPIPSNPYELKKIRSKGSPFQTKTEWLEASKQREVATPDALEYCAHSVGMMMALACKISNDSPIEPRQLTFVKGVTAHQIEYKG